MAVRVGINGFGRIGRLVVRVAKKMGMDDVNFVAANDITDAPTLAHLFKYDSALGRYEGQVGLEGEDLIVDGDHIKLLAVSDPTQLPWGDLGVDVVLECTGRLTSRDKAAVHLDRGARVVAVSAPAKGADCTFVPGVNQGDYKKGEHKVISIGSCTTNSLAPALKVLSESFGVEHGLMTTFHAYTNDQRVLDSPHKDLRRARAAAVSLIPTTTGAARAIGLVMPELEGKLDGVAVRAPVPVGSLTDLTCRVSKATDRDSVNEAFRKAAEGPLDGILEYCTDPIVSCDIVGNPHSSIFDSGLTTVMSGNMVKIFCWYDNEWGFSNRLAEVMRVL
jgi:glyceraldehyde 3-phosphate dehydrogenase